MTIAPEMLAAYADGELDAEAAGELELALANSPELQTKLAAHRALRARLKAHFAPVANQPVPDRLRQAVTGPRDGVSVIDFATEAKRPRPGGGSPRPWWIAATALAASLVLAFIGFGVRPSGDYARGTLVVALDSQLVAAQRAEAPVRILLSFQDKNGFYCRGFASQARSGIACREERGWRLRNVMGGSSQSSAQFQQAGSPEMALMAQAQGMAEGPALDRAQEAAAASRGWRKPPTPATVSRGR